MTPPPAPARSWFAFAPYVDLADYPAPELTPIRQAGVRTPTLGFVTARGGDDCVPTWGGYAAYPASGPGAYRLADVRAHRAAGAGNDVIVSFGGAAGAELAAKCTSVPLLVAAYRAVIDAYGVDHVDFDIEGDALAAPAAIKRRAEAIAVLQRERAAGGKPLRVALTLPVVPAGLDPDAVAVVRETLAAGVELALVNVMAMDYGAQAAPDPSGKMGAYAIQAATRTGSQLVELGLGSGSGLAHVGVTPMIGINDVATEVTTLADARALASWGRTNAVGMLGMWQLSRDRQCTNPSATTQLNCSGVAQQPWAFAAALGAVAG